MPGVEAAAAAASPPVSMLRAAWQGAPTGAHIWDKGSNLLGQLWKVILVFVFLLIFVFIGLNLLYIRFGMLYNMRFGSKLYCYLVFDR